MSSGFVITIFAVSLAVISAAAIIYGTLQGYITTKSKKSVSNTSKKLLCVNWSTTITFFLVTITIAVHSASILNDHIEHGQNFIKNFERDDLQTALVFASCFYLIGKFCLYFVLYFRLFYLLHKSLFAYQDKHYRIIKFIIISSIICACSMLGLAATNNPSLRIFSNVLSVFYLLLDITIPIWLNAMFIQKMYQIGKFMINMRSTKLGVNKYKFNATNINIQPGHDRHTENTNIDTNTNRDVTSNTEVRKHVTSKAHLDVSDNDVDTQDNINISMSKQSVNIDVTNNARKHGKKLARLASDSVDSDSDTGKLLALIARLSILSVTIAISSVMVLLFAGLEIFIGEVVTRTVITPILWITIAVDSTINVVCLILYFEFSMPLYNLLCGACCSTNCLATVMPKCLCKCCL